MKQKDLKILSKLRIERAGEFLKEAEFNFKNKFYRAAINRAYYGVFYAMKALLALEKAFPKTHGGTRMFFHLRFIKTKRLPPEIGQKIEELYKKRLDADYDDFITISKEDAEYSLKLAKEIISKIIKLQKSLL